MYAYIYIYKYTTITITQIIAIQLVVRPRRAPAWPTRRPTTSRRRNFTLLYYAPLCYNIICYAIILLM